MRIGYTPYKADLTGACDRRRFPYYARKRGLSFETYRQGQTYDLVIVTMTGDLAGVAADRSKIGKLVLDLPDSYLSGNMSGWRDTTKALYKRWSGSWSRWTWSYADVVRRVCIHSDAIACSTPEQQTVLASLNANVHPMLDFHEAAMLTRKTEYAAHQPFRLVWEGVGDSLLGFAELGEALQLLHKEHRLELHLLTDLHFRPLNGLHRINSKQVVSKFLGGVPNYLYEWNSSMLGAVARECDLAIVPVHCANAMARAKPENRMLIFWRMGLPVLASATPAYTRTAKDAGIQATCASADEWYALLKQAIVDQTFRQQNAQAGLEYLEKSVSEEILINKWDRLLQGVGAR